MKLATIGYEKKTLDELIGQLKSARVKTLIDIRAIAASRRAGFSKGILSATLEENGIAYVHLRALGTPKSGRDAARAGRITEMRAIYMKQLGEPEAQEQLARAMRLAGEHKSALLCFEADHAHCHRDIVAHLISDRIGCAIEDL